MGKHETAKFIEQVLKWWKIQNVSAKGQDGRMNDPDRAVQSAESTNLIQFNEMFSKAKSCKLEIYMILDLNRYYYYELICLFSLLRNMINMN